MNDLLSENIDPDIAVDWVQAIRPTWQSRHQLRDDFTYCGYIALYRFAAGFCRNQRTAEIGCGSGYGSYLLAHFAHQVFALDIDAKELFRARHYYRKDNLYFFAADALRTGLPDDYFDIVVSLETFEHLRPHQAVAFLQELTRIMSPQGALILTTPNKTIYDKISISSDHHNEMTVREWFNLLGAIFPQCQPFYQRKGEWQRQKHFYLWAGKHRRGLRRLLPSCLKNYVKKKLAPERQKTMNQLLIDLQVHPAKDIEELEDAVIQIAVCRKEKR